MVSGRGQRLLAAEGFAEACDFQFPSLTTLPLSISLHVQVANEKALWHDPGIAHCAGSVYGSQAGTQGCSCCEITSTSSSVLRARGPCLRALYSWKRCAFWVPRPATCCQLLGVVRGVVGIYQSCRQARLQHMRSRQQCAAQTTKKAKVLCGGMHCELIHSLRRLIQAGEDHELCSLFATALPLNPP